MAISVPSRPVTATKGAATAPNLTGPPTSMGRASSTVTRCTAAGTASRSTASRWSAAACLDTSSPGSWGEPGWAIHSMPCTVPRSSPSVAPATTGVPADTRISRRVWGKVWFCPRTSSAVIALSPRRVDVARSAATIRRAARCRAVQCSAVHVVGACGAVHVVQLPAADASGSCAYRYGPDRSGRAYRCGRIAGIRSWNVRPLAGLPRAVICHPAPTRCTLAMIWAVY